MKKLLFMLAIIITSGCVPYGKQTDLGDRLLVNGGSGKISNEKIIESLNKPTKGTIQKIIITGRVNISPTDDKTELPVIATLTNGTSENGFLSSTGRWSSSPKFNFLTEQEKYEQQKKQENKVLKQKKESETTKINTLKKMKENYQSASIEKYPYIAETYCYNRKTLEVYTPDSCGVSYNFLLDSGVGPNNSYDDKKSSYNIILKEHFNVTLSMFEPNPFLGIKVDIRSRKTNQIVGTRVGSYTDTVFIGN